MKRLVIALLFLAICMILTGIGNYQSKPNKEFDAMEKHLPQYLTLRLDEINYIQRIGYKIENFKTTRRHDSEFLKDPVAGRTRDGTPYIVKYFQWAVPGSKYIPSDKISTSYKIIRKVKNQKNPINEIRLLVHLYEYRERAYVAAVSHVDTSSSPPGKPGFPEKSFSEYPIGEICWSSAPKGSKNSKSTMSSNAHLSIHDDRFCITLDIMHFPNTYDSAGYALFEPIDERDLKLGEYLARMALSKAYMALYDFHKLQRVNLQVGTAKVTGVKINDKLILAPVKSLSNSLGGKVSEDNGVYKMTLHNKTITFPVGGRKIIIGKQQVKATTPIIYDGKEIWVEKDALIKALDTIK